MGKVVVDICNTIIDEFQDEVLMNLANADNWKVVVQHFEVRRGSGNCLIAWEPRMGSTARSAKHNTLAVFYFNYKKFVSIILLAQVNPLA